MSAEFVAPLDVTGVLPSLPAPGVPGLVITPVVAPDADDETGAVVGQRWIGWTVRHAGTGREIIGSGMTMRSDVDDAYDLADQLGALGLNWTAADPSTWPAGDHERVKAAVLGGEVEPVVEPVNELPPLVTMDCYDAIERVRDRPDAPSRLLAQTAQAVADLWNDPPGGDPQRDNVRAHYSALGVALDDLLGGGPTL